jgi:glycosyltransferase involved in cell wall biosynthesis
MVPCGIDVDVFAPDFGLDDKPEEGSILFLGRLHHQKGIFVLLDALEKVFCEYPNATLVIAGSGQDEREVRAKVRRHPYKENIRLLGHVERNRVPEVINQSSVLCMPSFGEPFGIVALEAMAAGKPIVGTDAGGLAHIIPEEGGYTVPPGESGPLADALVEVLSSAQRRQSMGKVNRRIVEERYDWNSVLDRLEHVYYNVQDGE